jgi:hypothetical protein
VKFTFILFKNIILNKKTNGEFWFAIILISNYLNFVKFNSFIFYIFIFILIILKCGAELLGPKSLWLIFYRFIYESRWKKSDLLWNWHSKLIPPTLSVPLFLTCIFEITFLFKKREGKLLNWINDILSPTQVK